MGVLNFLLVGSAVLCLYLAVGQTGSRVKIPRTRFTCQGRAAGYYADVETGCQVYHMCDALGRQFSYSCPNTTLFQQRMLICDHWYMVNCSMSERDYDANLLIGQRDKPFVSDDDMRMRTPRPDILSVPPSNQYYDGLKEAETSFSIHPGNSIVGIADSISGVDNNDLDSGKHNYRPPTSWSTGIGQQSQRTPARKFFNTNGDKKEHARNEETLASVSKEPTPSFRPTPIAKSEQPIAVSPPSLEISPPFLPVSTTEKSSEGLDARGRAKDDPVLNFIKRFDPNSPDSIKTSMTKTEILNINKQLPEGQVSSEEEKSPRRSKNFGGKGNTVNAVERSKNKGSSDDSRFDTVNVKPINPTTESTVSTVNSNQVPVPDRNLLPPKLEYSPLVTTTMGPPIYYEWKWAVPAFDLEPPKIGSPNNNTDVPKVKPLGKRPFSVVPRSTPKMVTPSPSNTEYNISSYFVPDYVFPLDGPHPGYDDDDAQTSFQVNIPRPGRASYGENPACPQCHPAYLKPGSCEPCIVKR